MNEKIEEIKKLLESATHGTEWTNFDRDLFENKKEVREYDPHDNEGKELIAACETVEQAEFIAKSPQYVRYLIEVIESLRRSPEDT